MATSAVLCIRHKLCKDAALALSGDMDADIPETLAVFGAHDYIWLSLPYMMFLQLLTLETSLALGITSDTDEVNRVVQRNPLPLMSWCLSRQTVEGRRVTMPNILLTRIDKSGYIAEWA
ncbi:hypothetical protein [Sodalis-like endosymbiont of Proechinophthirus fluctus]|uniref:hypothetical protein n=1 Tax=Sodalis-like endosymbiont of Proechinophthirus fluctus TaxID=1462730 RepID=UPI000835336D